MNRQLQKTLGTWQLWGIAVGLVISGEYFGWSYGWAAAGTMGFLVTVGFVATMFTAFIFSFTELTTSIPSAGGPFTYAHRAFGPTMGTIAGAAALIEFLFAPPAIALAIGAYLNVQFPSVSPKHIATAAYVLFAALNIAGVQIAASFELGVTLLAVAELLLFMAVVSPGFSWANFTANGWSGAANPGGDWVSGAFAAIPFAIWFFLAIEGVAFAAEEAKDVKRSIPRAYLSGMATLVVLALGVMIFAGGVGDWRLLSNLNDPLPQAMKAVVGGSSGWLHMLVWLGLFGLIASFHGIILAYSRQLFSVARAGYLPRWLATLHPRFATPYLATIAGSVIGLAAIYSDNYVVIAGQSLTANIVTLSVMGALTMYMVSMLALFRLRRTEPDLARPYRAPFYPYAPALALLLAAICLGSVVYNNRSIALLFAGLLAIAWLYARGRGARGIACDSPI
jgi:ethanolamine permease